MTDYSRAAAGAGDKAVEDLLVSFDGSDDDEAVAAFEGRLVELSRRAPKQVAAVAARFIESKTPTLRAASAYALGRAAECVEDESIAAIEEVLVRQARVESVRAVIEAVATALGHVWAKADDEELLVPRRYLRDRSVALRLAAAQHLALATPVPLPPAFLPDLEHLARDEDNSVRDWAEHGLSYRDGWPDA